MLQWLYKLGSPRHFYDMTTGFVRWLGVTTFILLAIGLTWGLLYAPPDYQMGDSYRIIYIHVPTSVGMLWIYGMMAIAAAMYMIWNIKVADIFARASAVTGACFAAVCLFTGAVWGKPTWGTYWIWDAKLTAALILFFIYLGIIALRSAFDSETSGSKAASVLTLVGVVNVPIVYYAANIWSTLHQPVSNGNFSSDSANGFEIFAPALINGFAMIGLTFLIVILRTRNEILWRERKAQWVRELVEREAAHA